MAVEVGAAVGVGVCVAVGVGVGEGVGAAQPALNKIEQAKTGEWKINGFS